LRQVATHRDVATAAKIIHLEVVLQLDLVIVGGALAVAQLLRETFVMVYANEIINWLLKNFMLKFIYLKNILAKPFCTEICKNCPS